MLLEELVLGFYVLLLPMQAQMVIAVFPEMFRGT